MFHGEYKYIKYYISILSLFYVRLLVGTPLALCNLPKGNFESVSRIDFVRIRIGIRIDKIRNYTIFITIGLSESMFTSIVFILFYGLVALEF